MLAARSGTLPERPGQTSAPEPVVHLHPTAYRYRGDADRPSRAGWPRSTAIWPPTSTA